MVDDYEPWRPFVSATLQKHADARVVGEAYDGLDALQEVAHLKPDLVLLDINLPTINGIEVASRIGHANPAVKILFTSQSNDTDLVSAALSNGAYGYVLKADAATELLPAIESVLRGEKFFSRRLRHSGH